ncbi:protein CBFA2T3-like isoform X2 [Ceratina calcarata]|uniref:Protein CBFA2T3-like isoform X2 n=1 Tax=Ceratina calcarata TaxID=156304 RepID=A0AAJ7JHM2_9HYME|nr:protein CBFA2T3-like isoform X2 [Ceratina calcarata]
MATAQGTPESDTGSFECFQNYTAPEVFVQGLAGIVDQQDVESMIRAQKQMLQRFEKTNEMLTNCNQLSVNRLKTAGSEFKRHTALLVEMKKDLDYIFKRIRVVRNKLNQQYPQAFNEAVRSSLAEEVIVEDVDCSVKPLEPEVVPLPSTPHTLTDRDPDSDGNKLEYGSMKVEGGTATSTLLQKVKVKEEAKERCGYQEKSPSTTTTMTTTSTSPANQTVTNASSNGGTVSSVPVVPSTNASSPESSHQPSTIVCHSSAPTVLVNADPFPVDLDLKSKPKASSASREKPREDVQPEAHSPSPRRKIPTKQSNGTRSSSDADSPLPPRSSKPESEDTSCGAGGTASASANTAATESAVPNCRTEEQNDASNRNNDDKNVPGNRCIAGVFAGHGELKSVLGTVVKFATGISPDTGDTVLTLVLALLSGGMTAEEFHSALQEATNYSLRGFVLPHLKQQLPALQRDLSSAARANGQNCSQYLQSNEAAVLEAVGLSADQVEVFGEHTGNGIGNGGGGGNQCSAHYAVRSNSNLSTGGIQHGNNATGGLHHYSSGGSHAPKRRASDTPYYENGLHEDVPVYGKRLNSWNRHHLQPQQPPESSSPYCWYHPLHSSSGSIHGHRHNHGHGGHGHGHGPNPMPPTSTQISQMSAFSGSHHLGQQQQQHQQQQHVQTRNGSLDDEWKNIHVMLNCILGMVEQTKTALAVLQTPGGFAPPSSSTTVADAVQNGAQQANNNPSSSNGAQVESSTGDLEGILKRFAREIVAQTIKAIEEKWAEMKRKDEEAVKRAVVAEVQRAERVAVAESRVNERLRVHRLLDVPAPVSQRNHTTIRQGPYLRVHAASSQVDANARIVPTPSSVSNSMPSTSEDEKEPRLQSVSSGSKCWNCGRPALETCGGCGIARYCGSFCQYRDWETGGHHASCGNSAPTREPRRSVSRSPPRMAASINEANVMVPISAASKPK